MSRIITLAALAVAALSACGGGDNDTRTIQERALDAVREHTAITDIRGRRVAADGLVELCLAGADSRGARILLHDAAEELDTVRAAIADTCGDILDQADAEAD